MKTAVYVLFFLFIAQTSFGQGWIIRGGIAMTKMAAEEDGEDLFNYEESDMYYDSESKARFMLSYRAGLVREFKIGDRIAMESGLIISGKGTRITYTETGQYDNGTYAYNWKDEATARLRLMTADLPIAVKYKVPYGEFIYSGKVGAFVGLSLFGSSRYTETYREEYDGSVYTSEGSSQYGLDLDKAEDRLNFGGNVGVGAEYRNYLFEIDYSLSALNPEFFGGDYCVNHMIAFSLGYKFSKIQK